MTSKTKTDFLFRNEGSICLLEPVSRRAKTWVNEHIGESNGYQPYYPTVVIEPRYVQDILDGIEGDGLNIGLK